MSHAMKQWEKVIDPRIRAITSSRVNQFGLIPGRFTMESIFILRQAMDKGVGDAGPSVHPAD